jgi:hypothetical protein
MMVYEDLGDTLPVQDRARVLQRLVGSAIDLAH